jgi:uncharacterized protein
MPMFRVLFVSSAVVAAAMVAASQGRAQNEGIGVLRPARPSFDCRAQTGVELAICADQALTEKDHRLFVLHDRLLQGRSGAERQQLLQAQRVWLKARNACSGPEIRTCLGRAYDERIREVEAALANN